MLCGQCLSICQQGLRAGIKHHSTIRELQDAARAHCQLCLSICKLFSNQINSARPTPALETKPFMTCSFNYMTTDASKPPAITFDLPWGTAIFFLLKISDQNKRQEPSESRASLSNTGSEEVWQVISSWINKCRSTHSQCPKLAKSQAAWYPTRLLDIGPKSAPLQHPRLIETVHTLMEDAYSTLSHCWGNSNVLTLTTENFEAFKDGITVDALPKTFQDALFATRKLGLRYIWIDSLCILQSGSGSKDDWRRESAMMHKIYENAYCNIGATAAQDGHKGLFYDRHPEDAKPTHIFLDSSEYDVRYRGEYIIVDPTILNQNLALAPLLQRGWVYQERLLAPRMLHFCSKEVVWECRSGTFCETYRNGVRPQLLDSRFTAIQTPIKTIESKDTTKIKMQQAWHNIVKSYTRCHLTYEEDKLLALSGIAQLFQSHLEDNDEYLAGIWRGFLPDALLWVAKAGARRVQTYRAPSWSWPSLEGPVTYDLEVHGETSTLLTVLDSKVSTYTANTTGQVIGGTLTVVGYLVVKSRTLSAQATSTTSSRVLGDFNPEGERIMWYLDDPAEIAVKDVLCLPVRVTGFGQLHGIILAKVAGKPFRYRRTGVFSARDFDLDLWMAGKLEKIVIE